MLASSKLDPVQLLPVRLQVGLRLRPDRRWVMLALDRTDYEKRGEWVQILMVSLVLDGRSLPLFWMVRNAHGNTPLKYWKRVLAPVIRELQAVEGLEKAPWLVLADREFVSMPFAAWLQDVMQVPCALRLKGAHDAFVARTSRPGALLSGNGARLTPNGLLPPLRGWGDGGNLPPQG